MVVNLSTTVTRVENPSSESELESFFQVAVGFVIFVEAPWVLGEPSTKLVGKLLNKNAESWR